MISMMWYLGALPAAISALNSSINFLAHPRDEAATTFTSVPPTLTVASLIPSNPLTDLNSIASSGNSTLVTSV